MVVLKECRESVRCQVQCKDCKNAKRISYYMTRCTATGTRVNRSSHKYCDFFAPKKGAKTEARKAGIRLTSVGGWIQGSDIPKGARVK
jgi:hypothetical protein